MPNMIRDGKKVWPTCPMCGCRLSIDINGNKAILTHFGFYPDRDARGCYCVYYDSEWKINARDVTLFL